MPIFRKFIRTVYGMRILFDSITAADIIRTKSKKSGVITNINVIIFLYNNRKGFRKVLDNNNKFKLYIYFIFN